MFMPLSKPNYFIVLTFELINQPVWVSAGEQGVQEKRGKKREAVLEDRVFTVLLKYGMKSRSEK